MKVDHQKFDKWMSRKGIRSLQCSCCGKTKWKVDQNLMEVRPFAGGNMVIGGNVYLYVAVRCDNCSNTKFFNAAVMDDISLAPASIGDDSPASTPAMAQSGGMTPAVKAAG